MPVGPHLWAMRPHLSLSPFVSVSLGAAVIPTCTRGCPRKQKCGRGVEKCDRERDERVRVVDLSALERPMRNKIGPTECCTMRQRTTASRDNGSP